MSIALHRATAFLVASIPAAAQSDKPHPGMDHEKLELQMHADMMRAMADVLAKYAARLPDRK